MKRIAIIDIGSNSIRLVLVQINKSDSFSVIDEVKETVRLGKDMTIYGGLNPSRIEKAIKTLSFFKCLCEAQGVTEIIAVATEAVRKASNQVEFINRVKSELDIEIRVLPGTSEAYYDYFGNINSMDILNALLIDIGGSSTELIWVEDRTLKASISLPFGAINLTEKFSLHKVMDEETEKDLKDYILSSYKEIPWLKEVKNVPLVGIGGTIRNIAKISRKKNRYPIHNLHNYQTTAEEVVEIYNMAKIKDQGERKKIKGLSKERADIFLGAAGAVVTLFEFLGLKELYVSGCGLREGIIYEYILQSNLPLEDVLGFSINNHILNHEMNLHHAHQVWKLTECLYNDLKSILNIDKDYYKILKTATLLHDCGIRVSYYDHHAHSFYIIANSKINGLLHKEQLMAAYVAALHRKNDFKVDLEKYERIINEKDIEVIEKLAILVRICENLDSGVNSNISSISCVIESDTVIISVKSKTDPILEISQALDCAASFEKIFGKKLIIQSSAS
ncbi:Ppx/GppA phosphatase family protein [Clostridium magnum]|uniref:Exopolyphosphatase n=1 Tax=Clostridium magnum DSM 2767 TaxID=1121326 RepID=A0A162RTC8_9CLOT|nr:Ppx/GppA phosphatase family protein [Clostridium magnum]KZL90350.1 exopolyphosphatase [Clostridium magnum DSM 2767]SHH82770.1 exopolyphosphatase / guanosine-5'-triphosphate,3'-diphosphate pyrophosphatase [Clostridium magnum DSM 2767]